MISAESAIRVLRRDLTVASVLKFVLASSAMICLLGGQVIGGGLPLAFGFMGIGAVWFVLNYRSLRGSALAIDPPRLIAAGQFDLAELQIEQVLRRFSFYRNVKLTGLHQLAVLRHAQRQWAESATLCRGLLRQRLGSLDRMAQSTRLILVDDLLELNDLHGAYAAILDLYTQRLSLHETIDLLAVQLDYESRIEAWPSMMHNITAKVQMAELMPTSAAAKAQAMLALAAKRSGRMDWADWLAKRVMLLGDIEALVMDRPALKEVFS